MEADNTASETGIVEQVGKVDEEFDIDLQKKGIFIAAIGAILGALLPWYSVFGVTVFGFEGDGILSLIVAALVLAYLWYSDNTKRSMLAGIGGGAVISLIAFYHVTGISAMGVYVTLLAGIGMLVAGVSGYRKLR